MEPVTLSDYKTEIEEFEEIGFVYLSDDDLFTWDDLTEKRRLVGNSTTPKEFEEVWFVWFFHQEKLFSFVILYDEYEPPTAQYFARQLANKTSLPRKGWRSAKTPYYQGGKRYLLDAVEAELKCSGFRVNVRTAVRNRANLTITDTRVEAEIKQLEKEIKLHTKREKQEKADRERKKKLTLEP